MRILGLIVILGSMFLSSASAQAGERVVLDANLWAFPEVQYEQCLRLPSGQLAVTYQIAEAGNDAPVFLGFSGYRGEDPAASLSVFAVADPVTFNVPLEGGLYCYALQNRVPVPVGSPNSERTNLAQVVHLRMALQP